MSRLNNSDLTSYESDIWDWEGVWEYNNSYESDIWDWEGVWEYNNS
jgi:hypothetical protein